MARKKTVAADAVSAVLSAPDGGRPAGSPLPVDGAIITDDTMLAVAEEALEGPLRNRWPDAITNTSTGGAHERLVAGCREKPGEAADNVKDFNWPNPLYELAFGNPGTSINTVARKWSIHPSTLQRAFKAAGYEQYREARIQREIALYESDDLIKQRAANRARVIEQTEEALELLQEQARKHESKKPTGGDGEAELFDWTPRDWAAWAKAKGDLEEIIRMALGEAVRGSGAAGGGPTVPMVGMVVWHEVGVPTHALPAGAVQAVEGEVVRG